MNVTLYCRLEFSLPATNGYRVTVSGEVEEPRVEVTVTGHSATAHYSAKGTVTPTSIKASFGALGKVAMRFSPTGNKRVRRVPPSCLKERPARVSSQVGSFDGRFEFDGESGYTHVLAHHAVGGLGDPITNQPSKPLACEYQTTAAEKKRELESVSLDGSPPRAGISFSAVPFFGKLPTAAPVAGASAARNLFFAYAQGRDGRVSVFRYATALGGPARFSFDQALSSANVAPPAPFSGSATFARGPGGEISWTGDLAVGLPGLGSVPLTGGGAELATVAEHLKQLEERLEAK